MKNIKDTLIEEISKGDVIKNIEYVKQVMHDISPLKSQPVNRIKWVPIDEVTPNDYNPNSVAKKEMGLLYTSIKHDGYTQPIVTIRDEEMKMYVIVDGFHRYYTAKTNPDILDRNKGYIPIVVIEKDINDRMASTVRHNRARGMHSVTGMSSMVFSMLENGWLDKDICNEIGMSAEELVKLKHITGFSKLFADKEYSKSWETKKQILLKKKYNE
jgi:ParB-like chromosome segregation protein Spo0J